MGASSSTTSQQMKRPASIIDALVKKDPIKPDKEVICDTETFSTVYRAKIKRYSKVKRCPPDFRIDCGTFHLAGHLWAISYYPKLCGIPHGVALQITLLTDTTTSLKQKVKITLIDPSGRRLVVADIRRQVYNKRDDAHEMSFMQKPKLDSSDYVKDDCLTIECTVSVTKWSPAEVVQNKPQSAITFSNSQEGSGDEADTISFISNDTMIWNA